MTSRRVAAVAVAVSVCSGVSVARAATFAVTTTADPPGGTCQPGSCSLRQAVAAVNAGTGGDTIDVPSGDYTLSQGSALSLSKDARIVGDGARTTVIHGTPTSRVLQSSAVVSAVISGVTIRDGHATSGGGILWNGNLTLMDSAVLGNVASSVTALGGGLDVRIGTLTLTRSLVAGNSAGNGSSTDAPSAGGIAIEHAAAISDSTIAGNSASGGPNSRGGGIATIGTSTAVSLTNVTLAGNSAGFGGGAGGGLGGNIDDESTSLQVENTIVSGGMADPASANCGFAGSGFIDTLGNNLESGSTCELTAATDLHTDPRLGALQNNGGPTDAQSPAVGSPAIDAGADAVCSGSDQRGAPRHQGAHCDIGAVERTTPAAGTPAVSNITANTASVTATANPEFLAGSYVYRYGTTTAYGNGTPTVSLTPDLDTQAATAMLTGLAPSTTYHLQLVVTTPDGTALSPDVTFTTASPQPGGTPTAGPPDGPPTTGSKPPATTVLSNLRVSPRRSSLSGHQANRPCARPTRSRHNGNQPCRDSITLRVSYTLNTAATVTFTLKRQAPGRKSGGRCVKPTKNTSNHTTCTRLVGVRGEIVKRGTRGANHFILTGTLSGHTLGPGTYQLIAITGRGKERKVTFVIVP